MSAYQDLKKKHQEEYNAFPVHFAFGQEQINRKIAELNLDPKNYQHQIVGIGYGGFILKKDVTAYKDMILRHSSERAAAIAADTDGTGYIYDMFLYELNNHEYGYTWDDRDTLDALGITEQELVANPALRKGLRAAKRHIEKRDCFS